MEKKLSKACHSKKWVCPMSYVQYWRYMSQSRGNFFHILYSNCMRYIFSTRGYESFVQIVNKIKFLLIRNSFSFSLIKINFLHTIYRQILLRLIISVYSSVVFIRLKLIMIITFIIIIIINCVPNTYKAYDLDKQIKCESDYYALNFQKSLKNVWNVPI